MKKTIILSGLLFAVTLFAISCFTRKSHADPVLCCFKVAVEPSIVSDAWLYTIAGGMTNIADGHSEYFHIGDVVHIDTLVCAQGNVTNDPGIIVRSGIYNPTTGQCVSDGTPAQKFTCTIGCNGGYFYMLAPYEGSCSPRIRTTNETCNCNW